MLSSGEFVDDRLRIKIDTEMLVSGDIADKLEKLALALRRRRPVLSLGGEGFRH